MGAAEAGSGSIKPRFMVNYLDMDLKKLKRNVKNKRETSFRHLSFMNDSGGLNQSARDRRFSRFLDPGYVSNLGMYLSKKETDDKSKNASNKLQGRSYSVHPILYRFCLFAEPK